MTETFRCDRCHGEFDKDTENWSDDDAEIEARNTFGEIPEDERAIVCHDCYELIMMAIQLGAVGGKEANEEAD
jgi:hypothetical protein